VRSLVVTVVIVAVVAGIHPAATAPTAASPNHSAAEPEIVELYPDPVAHDDRGEFVTLQFPAGTDPANYSLADDQAELSLPSERTRNATGTDRVTFSTHVNATRRLTNRTVVGIPDRLRLANSGERLRLRRQGTVVDTVQYGRTIEGELYDPGDEEWTPLAATDWSVVTAEGGSVEAFVLPDASDRVVEFLDASEERIYLAGYTLTSERVVDTLIDAAGRDVTVAVLVDGSPVGGMSDRMAAALDELARAGVDVRAFGGERARYRFHHAKYAVVDGRALVTTENWKPAGVGGRSSRGWGVITDQSPIVSALVATFRADTGWVDTVSWREYEPTVVEGDRDRATYPSAFAPASTVVEQTELLLAPDNAEGRILDVIDSADQSLEIEQVRIGDRSLPFLQAVIDAAERGVEVRILLGSEWYVKEGNRRLKRWLEEQAAADDLPLEVRLAEPDGAFGKIHAKGLIADDEQVFVGSLNWNNNSVRENREVGLLVESEASATYFREVFDADWKRDSGDELPLGIALACLFVAVLAVLGASRLEFE